jgi:hypothetical protein
VTPIADCRLSIADWQRSDSPQRFFNRPAAAGQSSIDNDSFDFLLPKPQLRANLTLLKREMRSEERGGCR